MPPFFSPLTLLPPLRPPHAATSHPPIHLLHLTIPTPTPRRSSVSSPPPPLGRRISPAPSPPSASGSLERGLERQRRWRSWSARWQISAWSSRESPTRTSVAVRWTRFSRLRRSSRLRRPTTALTASAGSERRVREVARLAKISGSCGRRGGKGRAGPFSDMWVLLSHHPTSFSKPTRD